MDVLEALERKSRRMGCLNDIARRVRERMATQAKEDDAKAP
jgi:hypothetical protein